MTTSEVDVSDSGKIVRRAEEAPRRCLLATATHCVSVLKRRRGCNGEIER